MKCPRCQAEMRDTKAYGCTVKTCPKCEGTWYPGETLGRVSDHSLSELREGPLRPTLVADKLETVDLQAPILCPCCERPMIRYRYTMGCDAVLDECLEHGVWLDDGELGSLLEFLESILGPDEDPNEPFSSGVLDALHQIYSRPR